MKRRINERIEIGDEVYSPRDEYYVTVLDIKGDRVLVDGPMGEEYHNLSDLEKKEDYESEDLYEGRKKVIRLTESDLARIVKRVIKEESQSVDTVCLKQAGYKETNIGGPMTRRIVYEKKNGNVLRQISLKGGTLEKFVGDKKYKCSCNCKNGVVTESNCKESSKEVY
jgi:hypothetical protein